MIVSVWIPYFATALEADIPDQSAVLIFRKTRVLARNAAAVRAGVLANMPLSRARALCPQAVIRPAAPDRWRRILTTQMEWLSRYSQYVEAARHPGQTATIALDPGKLRAGEGLVLAEEIRQHMAGQGFAARVGLASNRFTASVAARTAQPVQLVPQGDESRFLAALPVSYLPLNSEMSRRLSLFGLERIGHLAALPAGALAAQFGADGERLARLARGKDSRPVARFVPECGEQVSHSFDPPLEDRQILERVVGELLTGLSTRLQSQGQSCREVILTIRSAAGGSLEICRKLREPVTSASPLLRLLRLPLERLMVSDAVQAVEITLLKLAPILPQQLSLFGDEAGTDVRLKLLAVTSRYGDDRLFGVRLSIPLVPLPELGFSLERVEVA